MKNLGYRLLKFWIKSGLYLYYGRIRISGLENVPKSGAVLFLPNHQGALMDVLLIVTDCNRKPYFLTRSDVFGHPLLNKFFNFLRMLPIYRIRDGRETLKKNRAIFDHCARLFRESNALVLFPEANHNLQRRVRPMSKGFTRILFNTFDKYPELDVHVVPVGMNYRSNISFPDKVAVHYDAPISMKNMYEPQNHRASVDRMMATVSERLKGLTTHIADAERYDEIVASLDATTVDYLSPKETNAAIKNLEAFQTKNASNLSPARSSVEIRRADFDPDSNQKDSSSPIHSTHPNKNVSSDNRSPENVRERANPRFRPTFIQNLLKGFFILLNLPIIAVWRLWIRPKVWEPEFTGTLRFGFALLAYPIYYLMLFSGITIIWNGPVAFSIVLGLFLFNLGYVRQN